MEDVIEHAVELLAGRVLSDDDVRARLTTVLGSRLEELEHLQSMCREARPILIRFAQVNQMFTSLDGETQDPLGVHKLLARWPRSEL